MLLAIRPFISFESARIEEGALQDIQSSRLSAGVRKVGRPTRRCSEGVTLRSFLRFAAPPVRGGLGECPSNRHLLNAPFRS